MIPAGVGQAKSTRSATSLTSMSDYHIPVMLSEVLDNLDIQKGLWYVDCNLGGGGHTEGILSRGGKVLGIDLDEDAIQEVARNHKLEVGGERGGLRAVSENLILAQSNFSAVKRLVGEFSLDSIAGVLFDLGVSSYQLEKADRGFSFNTDAPLDMRMNQGIESATAADLVNGLHEKELTELFLKLGEENFARPIAKRIVEKRKLQKIETTNQLANIVLSVRHRTASDRTHPATRVFQALRIAVNDELNSLKDALPEALSALSANGRLVVISFHSLEDRIVKVFMNEEEEKKTIKILTPKPLEPTDNEVTVNPRSRSGKLRIAQKII